MGWKTKGMNRDMSVSAFNPKFSFENINLRLSTNEGNTAMSWVNEKGTLELTPQIVVKQYDSGQTETEYTIEGIAIGTAVLNEYLVLFTTSSQDSNNPDRIYRLECKEAHSLTGVLLYKGNLSFNAEYPLETLASYESDMVQKVYWVDGLNQPRMINIVSPKSTYLQDAYKPTSFDFIQELSLRENIFIQKQISAGGMFAPGVIQYSFTYYNKNGQESNIFYTSPLLYVSHSDRGASPEDRVSNAFKIQISNVDKSFDYLRIYSIQRTSLNSTPIVKRVQDIETASLSSLPQNKLTYNSFYAVDSILSIKKGEEDLSSFQFESASAAQDPSKSIGNSQAPFVKAISTGSVVDGGFAFCGTGNNRNPSSSSQFYGWLGFRLKSYKDNNSELTIQTFDGIIRFKSDVTEIPVVENLRLYDTENLYSEEPEENYSVPTVWVSCVVTRTDEGFTAEPTKVNGTYGKKYYIVTTDKIIGKKVQDEEGGAIQGYYYVYDSGESDTVEKDNLMQFEGFSFSFIDTGTVGNTIDPYELLYKGGNSIIAGTMDQKDNTLFLGNIRTIKPSLKDVKDLDLKDSTEESVIKPDSRSFVVNNTSTNDYVYGNQLSAQEEDTLKSVSCGGFKRGEIYRCGIQFQYKDGTWSEPAFLEDAEEIVSPIITGNKVTVPTFKYTLSQDNSAALLTAGYRKARALVVFPDITDRKILCQGVVNSTLYTTNQNNHQSSWFFRCQEGSISEEDSDVVFTPKELGFLPYTKGADTNPKPSSSNPSLRQVEIQGSYKDENKFLVDNDIWTFHTPELDYEEAFPVLDFTGTSVQQVGETEFFKTFSSIYIQTESPTASSSGAGFIKESASSDNSKGFIAGLFYDDWIVNDKNEAETTTSIGANDLQKSSTKWLVYPWHRNGSLNNDVERGVSYGSRTAILKKKVLSNQRISNTIFTNVHSVGLKDNVSPQIFNSDQTDILKIGDIIYQGNVDTLLSGDDNEAFYFAYNSGEASDVATIAAKFKTEGITSSFNQEIRFRTHVDGPQGLQYWKGSSWLSLDSEAYMKGLRPGTYNKTLIRDKQLVRMKYKSSPHIVFPVDSTGSSSVTPYVTNGLKICEILSSGKDDTTRFGGTTADALQANTWIPCGEPVTLDASKNVDILYSYGDTYFQRWDCLKTSPLNTEDINQIVEIGSFMLETRLNIDGRYDRNRGLLDNTNTNDRNFNLYNPVYSQINNFFSYKIMPDNYYQNTSYKNQLTWSLEKQSGADVDAWTNITLASVLELDGDKGKLNKIIRFNDTLLAFQDTGISQILYNENTQITTTAGVPIEIANSGKVQGKRYISNTIGCINKWSMVTTPMGIYFIDSIGKSIYLFNGQLTNISASHGFNSWCNVNIPTPKLKSSIWPGEWLVWTPKKELYSDENTEFVGYYDKNNQDVLFINNHIALAWSEKIQAFTSFYNYEKASYLCNLNAIGLWFSTYEDTETGKTSTLVFEHQAGETYCNFFNTDYPYSTTLVGNPEASIDKIFTNLEFIASVDTDGVLTSKFTPICPFDSIESWNEYQHGKNTLSIKNIGDTSISNKSSDASLQRKFRIWRCDIPRDNYPLVDGKDVNPDKNIYRYSRKPLDRMRNPWIYIALQKHEGHHRTEIHDVVLVYYT